MTTKTDLDALDALHAKATAGEWVETAWVGTEDGGWCAVGPHHECDEDESDEPGGRQHAAALADAALIVALHNAWPTVAAELRRARKIEAAAVATSTGCTASIRGPNNDYRIDCEKCPGCLLRAALDAPDESGGR